MPRILAALGVAVWSFLVLSTAMALATSPGSWLIALGIGVVAPIVLMTQINRAISSYEDRKQAVPDAGDRERSLLEALKERGEITPATAAMRTSLTVEEAARILEKLAGKGYLKLLNYDGALVYSLFETERVEGPNVQAITSGTLADPAIRGSLNGKVALGLLPEPLSERELEVLQLLASGRTNREIARDLFVTVGTVKSHTSNIYGKLETKNRTEALAKARTAGLLK